MNALYRVREIPGYGWCILRGKYEIVNFQYYDSPRFPSRQAARLALRKLVLCERAFQEHATPLEWIERVFKKLLHAVRTKVRGFGM